MFPLAPGTRPAPESLRHPTPSGLIWTAQTLRTLTRPAILASDATDLHSSNLLIS